MNPNRLFIRHIGLYLMCFSSNLHLDDKAEPDIWNFNSSGRKGRHFINYFNLKMPTNESLLYWSPPVVQFSVHSPFIEIGTISTHELLLGHTYEINYRLEEEHLLPHPFPTDCTDYDELWRKNNKTGPRSQEVCENKCLDPFKEQCWGYILASNLCNNNESCKREYASCKKMDLEEIPKCEMNCKANCLEMKYSFTLKDTTEKIESTEELFSYIGGLMGCWLGMSVWASVGIFENAYRKIVRVMRQLGKK
ncbi:uncharacterized protein NPIL_314951 [Nephila pilipes]|uniref:Uncharacterized protein n=1 Tax=Nephila pilipes TaxID=299642 RepID=A0A8X6P149_NEPPI|nr:uncharacterized protein NPIL_314951 [Nephila pilipes]